VLLLDVQHDRMLGMIKRERPIALVALHHKQLPLSIPVGIRAENRNLGADVVRRMQPTPP
jgi:hypothetical protein